MSDSNRPIPYGESWTCTHGDCCTDERCERWTWRVSIATVLLFVGLGIVAVARVLV